MSIRVSALVGAAFVLVAQPALAEKKYGPGVSDTLGHNRNRLPPQCMLKAISDKPRHVLLNVHGGLAHRCQQINHLSDHGRGGLRRAYDLYKRDKKRRIPPMGPKYALCRCKVFCDVGDRDN